MRRLYSSEIAPQDSSVGARAALHEVASAFRRDRKWILLAFSVPMLLFIALSFVPKPLYQSTSSMLVRFGREYVYNPEGGDGKVQPMSFDRDQALHAEAEILASRDVIDRALTEVGVNKVYPSIANDPDLSPTKLMAKAAERVTDHLNAELLKGSNVIEVRFAHPDPEIAAKVVNQLIATYLERRRTIFAISRSGLVGKQVNEYGQDLKQVEADLRQFQQAHSIVSFDKQLSLLLDERHALDLKLADAAQEEAAATARVQLLTRTLAGVNDPALPMAARTSATSRGAVEVDLIRARADAGAAANRQSTLQTQSDAATQRIAELSALEMRFEDLKRAQSLAENRYVTADRQLQDALAMDERDLMAQTNVSVFQKGLKPVTAKSYQPLIIGAGFMVSICFALLIAFALAMMRQTFLRPESVERSLGLPVLADIPVVR